MQHDRYHWLHGWTCTPNTEGEQWKSGNKCVHPMGL